MENVFKKFNEDFWKSEKSITWYDTQGVMNLDDQRVVTFSIEERGMRDHYVGYNVKIYNKTQGEIVSKFFRFKDHLEMVHRENTSEQYHVWSVDGKFDWYISRPKNTKEMVKVIMDWISMFK